MTEKLLTGILTCKTNFLLLLDYTLEFLLAAQAGSILHGFYNSAKRLLYGRYLMNTLLGMVYF